MAFESSNDFFKKVSELLRGIKFVEIEFEMMPNNRNDPRLDISHMGRSLLSEFEMNTDSVIFIKSVLFERQFLFDIVLRFFNDLRV